MNDKVKIIVAVAVLAVAGVVLFFTVFSGGSGPAVNTTPEEAERLQQQIDEGIDAGRIPEDALPMPTRRPSR